jgi:hypothetical protein
MPRGCFLVKVLSVATTAGDAIVCDVVFGKGRAVLC